MTENPGHRVWIILGGLAGLAAVAMEAAAAHALAPRIGSVSLGLVRSANQMLGWHALALVLCGIWAERVGGHGAGRLAHLAGMAFTLGVLGFCGSLYLVALAGLRLPGVAPAGGVLLMLGWLLLGLSALHRARPG